MTGTYEIDRSRKENGDAFESMTSASATATPLSLEAIAFAPRFAMAICEGMLPQGKSFDAHLRAELSACGIRLEQTTGADCLLVHGDLTIGRACLLTPDQARARFGKAPFLDWTSPCPFVGKAVGYLVWDHFISQDPPRQRGAFTDLIKGVLAAGQSFIARLDTGDIAELAVERRLPLSDLTNRWGFDDGERLLTRGESPYARAACRTAEEALAALGLKAEVEWVPTSHNPLRLSWHVLPSSWRQRIGLEPRRIPGLYGADGKPRSPRVLNGKFFTLWVLDLGVLHNTALWSPRAPRA